MDACFPPPEILPPKFRNLISLQLILISSWGWKSLYQRKSRTSLLISWWRKKGQTYYHYHYYYLLTMFSELDIFPLDGRSWTGFPSPATSLSNSTPVFTPFPGCMGRSHPTIQIPPRSDPHGLLSAITNTHQLNRTAHCSPDTASVLTLLLPLLALPPWAPFTPSCPSQFHLSLSSEDW